MLGAARYSEPFPGDPPATGSAIANFSVRASQTRGAAESGPRPDVSRWLSTWGRSVARGPAPDAPGAGPHGESGSGAPWLGGPSSAWRGRGFGTPHASPPGRGVPRTRAHSASLWASPETPSSGREDSALQTPCGGPALSTPQPCGWPPSLHSLRPKTLCQWLLAAWTHPSFPSTSGREPTRVPTSNLSLPGVS